MEGRNYGVPHFISLFHQFARVNAVSLIEREFAIICKKFECRAKTAIVLIDFEQGREKCSSYLFVVLIKLLQG